MIILPPDIREKLSHLTPKELEEFCIKVIRESITTKTTQTKAAKKNLSKANSIQIFTDGGARGNPGPAGAGWVIKQNNKTILDGYKYLGRTTNNQAEYLGLILGLQNIQNLQTQEVEIFMDSELIVKQIKGQYKVKNEGLKPLFSQVIKLLPQKYTITHIKRNQNKEADKLANIAMDKKI